ncbi:MAG: DUF4369 domain-containing protein [Saprospiraceae bacterium]|nr:DUF4369 domain-containing protein [Saprospiraceae bacterium]
MKPSILFVYCIIIFSCKSSKEKIQEQITEQISTDPYLMIIDGTIRGMIEPDTLYVYHSIRDAKPMDTFYVKNEKFYFKTRIPNKGIWYVTDLWYHMDHGFEFWAEPGHIHISSNYDSLWYMESAGSNEQIAFTKIYNDLYRLRLPSRKIMDHMSPGDIMARNQIQGQFTKINEWLIDEIIKYKNSPLGPSLLFRYAGSSQSESDYITILDTFTDSSLIMLDDDIKMNIKLLPENYRHQKLRLSWALPDANGKNWSLIDFNDYFKIVIPISKKTTDKSLLKYVHTLINESKVPRKKVKIIGIALNQDLFTATKEFFDLVLIDNHGIYYNAFQSLFGNLRESNVYFYTPQNQELSINMPNDVISNEWASALKGGK